MSTSQNTELARAVISALTDRGESLAVAESLTGGALCSALVDIPGASAVLRGGVVSYSNDAKTHALGVDSALIAKTGPVTEDVAVAMATGVRQVVSAEPADWAVSTTGVAGPDPDAVSGTPAGVVWIAVIGPAGSWSRQLELSGDRNEIRAGVVTSALALLNAAISGSVQPGE